MNIYRVTACFLNGSDHPEVSALDPVLFGIGSVSVLGQVILFREWMVAGYGVELICILALGAWMLLNAAGVFLAASRSGSESVCGAVSGRFWGFGRYGFHPVAAEPGRPSSGNLSSAVRLHPGCCCVSASALPVSGCGLSAGCRSGDAARPHAGPRLCRGMRGQRIRRPVIRPDAALGRSEHGPGPGLRGHHDGRRAFWPWSECRAGIAVRADLP